MKKLNLHWFCTQNHILEPFSVRRACTQCYVTLEPYPRPSQIWCQNVRETRKKIVIKCRSESFAGCRVIVRYVEGGGLWYGPPPVFLGLRVVIELSVQGRVGIRVIKVRAGLGLGLALNIWCCHRLFALSAMFWNKKEYTLSVKRNLSLLQSNTH